jgi:hypothetical protein
MVPTQQFRSLVQRRNHRSSTMTGIADKRGLPRCAVLLLAFSFIVQSVQANICFLLYQNADNCFESIMRKHLKDYIASPAIQDPSVTSWVYFDAFNIPNDQDAERQREATCPIIDTPLEDVWTSEGSQLLVDSEKTKFEGSYYLNYDHNEQKMKVDKEVDQEQNSDDPQTLWAFVGYATQHCLSQNATDIFLVMNGFGAGSIGIGGDFNPGKQGARRNLVKSAEVVVAKPQTVAEEDANLATSYMEPPLVETNDEIAMALSAVLENLPDDAPNRFSVIGFDGHFMQTFHVATSYMPITEHILASESLVPQHGKKHRAEFTLCSVMESYNSILITFLLICVATTQAGRTALSRKPHLQETWPSKLSEISSISPKVRRENTALQRHCHS